MTRFTLDGRDVEAAPGETIWTVAQREGTDIPHLCHLPKPGYRPDGNCRACLVEVEGERTLVASCIRAPREGMVVRSASTRAETARRMVFELLLAELSQAMADASICGLGQAAPNPIACVVKYFPQELDT